MRILRTSLIVAVTAILLVGASPADAAKRKPKPSCAKKGSKTVVRSRDARLFTARATDGGGENVKRLYGCLTAVGRRIALADAAYSDPYNSTDFADVRLAGRYAAWLEQTTDASCKAECPPEYQTTRARLHVYDLRRRRSVRSRATDVNGQGLVLTGDGTVAWLYGNRLLSVDRAGGRTLDTGTIAESSLRVQGSVVSWIRDGIERFARLR